MVVFYRLISTCLGIGYTPKGGGTVAAVVCCIAWYFAWASGNDHLWASLIFTVVVLFLGVWTSGKMESYCGKDSYRIVIDEVAGMALTLLFVPVRWQYVLIGLILFRFFDIAKPLGVRRMEALGGGWGVMMDDVLAGVYSNLLLQIIVWLTPWKAL